MTTGREASIERRRALSQGQAGLGIESGQQTKRRPLQGEAAVGRGASVGRRRQLSAGKAAVEAPSPAPVSSGQDDAAAQAALEAGGTLKLPNPAWEASASEIYDRGDAPAHAAPPRRLDVPVGRDASIARRIQLSAGKAAVEAPAPAPMAGGKESGPSPAASGPAPKPAAVPSAQTPIAARGLDESSGRGASIARRLRLSAGKTAIPGADMSSHAGIVAPDGSPVAGRDASRIRRRQLSGGKAEISGTRAAEAGPAAASGPGVPQGQEFDSAPDNRRWAAVGRRDHEAVVPERPGYPLKVVQSRTHSGQVTTGLRIGPGERVTGDERGVPLPVTGNQYFGEETGSANRGRPTKVGATRTPGGLEVSGTLVRSKIAVTGDERGESIAITGEADQTLNDDLTSRSDSLGSPQFPRRTDPHGHNAAASEFLAGRSGQAVKARRNNAAPHEVTFKGHAVSGTAVGRSELMTGAEDGADRYITGSQYAASSRAATGVAGFEPPAQGRRSVRLDPVTGAKVVEARTWGGQRVTGPAFEHVAGHVTGSEAGSYIATTGTPYQGPQSVESFLGPDAASNAAQRVIRQPAREAVTGDTPLSANGVTGTQRGANRDITGTPYYREAVETEASGNPVAEIDHAFTIASPQRRAQLRAAGTKGETNASHRITGAFAVGSENVTGNLEFLHTPRTPDRGERAERTVTGEGASSKNRITGDSWRDQSNVTGTEGYIASGRNPTQRGGKQHGFAGAKRFKPAQPPLDSDVPVTGILTDKEDAALRESARVTVSGGATV